MGADRQFHLELDAPPCAGDEVLLDAEESHHLQTVLRRAPDEILVLTDGRGHRCRGRHLGRQGKLARVEILEVVVAADEVRAPRLRLLCGVVKGRRWERVLEQAVELGVHALVPLRTERGVVEPGPGRRDRWHTILRTALKQSGRAWLPDLAEPVDLADGLAHTDGPVVFGDLATDAAAPPPVSLVPAVPGGSPPAWLTGLVGPEGGWSPAERELLLTGSASPLSLGPHVLRTETAAAALLVLLQQARQRWLSPGPPP